MVDARTDVKPIKYRGSKDQKREKTERKEKKQEIHRRIASDRVSYKIRRRVSVFFFFFNVASSSLVANAIRTR